MPKKLNKKRIIRADCSVESNLPPSEALEESSVLAIQTEKMDITIRSRCETDEGDAYTLSTSLKRYDLYLKLGLQLLQVHRLRHSTTDEELKVHKIVICGQSKYFSHLFDEEWKEVTENSIDLMDDDPRTIEAMIHFMYGFDYDSSGNSRGRISPMLFNARVYGVAEKYGVSHLKQEAKAKFEDAVRTCWDMDDFPPVIMEVYTSTISTDRGLRDVLVDTAYTHVDSLLQKDPFLFILGACAGFSADVLQLLARKPSLTKYKCPNCSGTWEGNLPRANQSYSCSNWSKNTLRG
ncbi:hypothetical protein ACJ73_05172 [Blastomyces percursus]|uniref:BTB domain-containing protein n=1 Tax=Blastomyces percursus TaxID=1658174 RepID=A0A1J9QTC4_9EURO|nr:hypothetical protein ACJ73_05172 [Blastomyces percursus]